MADITLFGETRCHKTRFYQAALDERGLDYELAEVDKDAEAARRLTELAGSADKFPTFQIRGRKLRNPLLPDLDKELARAGLYDPGLIHDERSQRLTVDAMPDRTPTRAFAGGSVRVSRPARRPPRGRDSSRRGRRCGSRCS